MITEKQRELLQHMLGADERYKKKQWGFRNYFCCGNDKHGDYEELKKMELVGLVVRGVWLEQIFFSATLKGAIAIGFKKYQLKKLEL